MSEKISKYKVMKGHYYYSLVLVIKNTAFSDIMYIKYIQSLHSIIILLAYNFSLSVYLLGWVSEDSTIAQPINKVSHVYLHFRSF